MNLQTIITQYDNDNNDGHNVDKIAIDMTMSISFDTIGYPGPIRFTVNILTIKS